MLGLLHRQFLRLGDSERVGLRKVGYLTLHPEDTWGQEKQVGFVQQYLHIFAAVQRVCDLVSGYGSPTESFGELLCYAYILATRYG